MNQSCRPRHGFLGSGCKGRWGGNGFQRIGKGKDRFKNNFGVWPKAMLTVAWGKRSAAPGPIDHQVRFG